jgi:hypothetical protein
VDPDAKEPPMIRVFLEPGVTYKWGDFIKKKPPYSIALDGIVNGPTIRRLSGPYLNLDHHAGVDRTATRSTSEQAHMEINLGLFKTFRKDGIPTANIYISDIDEDVCVAVWLLQHFERVVDHAEPSINRLVYCEDRLDATSGAYPLGDIAMRRQMAWIFEPYQRARFEGKLRSMSADQQMAILQAVMARITDYTLGKGSEIGLDGQFVRIGGGKGWTFVTENGPASRMAMYASGIDAFGVHMGQRTSGGHDYVFGRRSVWVPFDIPKIIRRLNAVEKVVSDTNRWGGSNTIMGSPRGTGSSFSPQEIERIVNEI